MIIKNLRNSLFLSRGKQRKGLPTSQNGKRSWKRGYILILQQLYKLFVSLTGETKKRLTHLSKLEEIMEKRNISSYYSKILTALKKEFRSLTALKKNLRNSLHRLLVMKLRKSTQHSKREEIMEKKNISSYYRNFTNCLFLSRGKQRS